MATHAETCHGRGVVVEGELGEGCFLGGYGGGSGTFMATDIIFDGVVAVGCSHALASLKVGGLVGRRGRRHITGTGGESEAIV